MEEERNMAGKGRLVSHRHSLVSLLEASEPYPHCGAQVKSLVSSLISNRKKKKKRTFRFFFRQRVYRRCCCRRRRRLSLFLVVQRDRFVLLSLFERTELPYLVFKNFFFFFCSGTINVSYRM